MVFTSVCTVLGAVLGSGLIQFFINRKDSKDNELQNIKERLIVAERDSRRTQLLLMMSDYASEINEIMTIAQHYFVELHGDWYMTAVFNNWLVKNGIAQPEWLKEE